MPLPARTTYRQRGLRLLQALVTLGLLAWLVGTVDWAAVVPLLGGLQWVPLVGTLVCLLFSHLANVLRWQYLLDRPELRFGSLVRWYAIGLFGGNILPTGIGGDAVRAGLAGRAMPLGRALLAVALDRVIGLVALSALLVLGLAGGLPPGLAVGARLWPYWPVLVGLLALGVLAGVALLAWVRRPSARLRGWLGERTRRWELPGWDAGEWLRRLAGSYLISLPAHLGIVAANIAVLAALAVFVPWQASVWLVILSSLSLLLPISVNGIGVVEGVYVLVLASYGIDSAAGLSAALLLRLLGLGISLLGGLALLGGQAAGSEVRL